MKTTTAGPVSARELRKFGLLVGPVLLVLGAFFFWQEKPLRSWLALPGLVLVILGLLRPLLLRRVHAVWMAVAGVMGTFMTAVLLTLVYLLVITPLALAARAMGKDLLHCRPDPGRQSYWRSRDPDSQDPAACERQY